MVSNTEQRPAVLGGTPVYVEFRKTARPAPPFEMPDALRPLAEFSHGLAGALGRAIGLPDVVGEINATVAIMLMLSENPILPFSISGDWDGSTGTGEAVLAYRPTPWWSELPDAALITWLAAELGVSEPDRDSARAGILRLGHGFLGGLDPAGLLRRAMLRMRAGLQTPEILDELAEWAKQFAD
jgi:hypothetical protein